MRPTRRHPPRRATALLLAVSIAVVACDESVPGTDDGRGGMEQEQNGDSGGNDQGGGTGDGGDSGGSGGSGGR